MLTQYVTSQRVMFYNCNTFTPQHLIIKNAIARHGLHLLYAWEKSPSRPLAHFLSLPLFYSISLFASLTGRNYSYSIEKKFFQLFQKLLLMIYKTYTVKKEKKHYIFLLCILPLQKSPLLSTFCHSRSPQFSFCQCESAHQQILQFPKSRYKQIQVCNASKIYSNYEKILKQMMRKYYYTTNGILILKKIISNSHYTIFNYN